MKRTTKTANGTSFHNDTFNATVDDLRIICGIPVMEHNDGSDKVNFNWAMETEDGDVFTIYDWKEYRTLTEHESIEWHIGGKNGNITSTALNEIADALNNI